MQTIFEKILSGELATDFLYEDDFCVAFNDISPQAPVHCLIIPKIKIVNLKEDLTQHTAVLGQLMAAVPKVAAIACPKQDFRIVVNNGVNASQTVFYLHIHLLAGRSFSWPPG